MATTKSLTALADSCWNCARRQTEKPRHPSMRQPACTSCLHFRYKDFSNR